MATMTPTYDEFKVICRDFLVAAPTAALDELDAGMKCVGLCYLGIQFDDGFLGEINRTAGAPALMRICAKAFVAREFELEAT